MKKLIKGTVLLAAILICIVIIANIFGGDKSAGIVGEWTATHIIGNGTAAELGNGYASAVFKKDGSCTITMGDNTNQCTWREFDFDEMAEGLTDGMHEKGMWMGVVKFENGVSWYAYVLEDEMQLLLDQNNGYMYERK